MAKGIFNIVADKIFPAPTPGSNQIENPNLKTSLFSLPISRGDADAALNHITGQFVARQNPTIQTAAVNRDGDDNQKTVTDFLRQIQSTQPFDEAALSKKKEHVELKLSKPPEQLSVADYDAATWRAVFNKAGYSLLTDEEVGMAVQAMKNTGYKSTNDGFSLSNLRRFDALPGPMFVGTDKATIEKAKQAGQAVLQYQEYKAKQTDANQEKAQSEVNQMFADQGRVLWNSAVNITEGTINTALDAATTNGGANPLPLLNPNRPQADFSGAKSDYRSEMMRRDLSGKLDGDGIKAGKFIETGVTIAAPIVVGVATAPKAAPQSLKMLGGLPETEAATTAATATNNAAKAEQSAKWIDAAGNIKYPPNDGFAGVPKRITLKPGTLIDRYGNANGTFVSPKGTAYAERALPPDSNLRPYHTYEVVKPIEGLGGKIAPWFDEPGGGIQFKFEKTIKELKDEGYIIERSSK